MKQVIPEIYIRNCKRALDFYQQTFGGEIKNLQMSDDIELFRDIPNKVIHSELHINRDCVFYFVDVMDETRTSAGNISLVLHFETREEIERVYRCLMAGGKALMELQQTFWGAWHAIVSDRFGSQWALNCAK